MNADEMYKLAEAKNKEVDPLYEDYLASVHIQIKDSAKQGHYEVKVSSVGLLTQGIMTTLEREGFCVTGDTVSWRPVRMV